MADIDEPMLVKMRLLVVEEFNERGILEAAFARSLPTVKFDGASSAGGAMRAFEIYNFRVNYNCIMIGSDIQYGTGAECLQPVEGLQECCSIRLLRRIRFLEREEHVVRRCYIIFMTNDPLLYQSPIVQELLGKYGCIVKKPLDFNKLAFLVSDVLDVPCELDSALRPQT